MQTLANTYLTVRKQVLLVFAKAGVQLIIYCIIVLTGVLQLIQFHTGFLMGGGDFIVLGGGHA